MYKKRSKTTGVNSIKDEKRNGYLVDPDGKIVDEATHYDPYSREGSIMMYEMDSFGFTYGYLKEKYTLSAEDLYNDPKLSKEFEKVLYKNWKRKNIARLWMKWDKKGGKEEQFEYFCKRVSTVRGIVDQRSNRGLL